MKKKLTVENTGFRPNQELSVKAIEYYQLNYALDELMERKLDVAYPARYKTVDEQGEPVENPSKEDLESGKVKQFLDVHNTFNSNNAIQAYTGAVSPLVLEAMRVKYDIHLRELKEGRAVDVEVLQKEHEENQKSKLEVVK